MTAPFDLGIDFPEDHTVDELLLGAYHEAGHMAVSEGTGIKVDKMWISHSRWSGVEGATMMDFEASNMQQDPTDPRMWEMTDAQVHSYLLTCLAGARAVRMWYLTAYGTEGPIGGVDWASGSGTDERHFRDMNRYARLPRSRADAECDRLLRLHWARITAASERLYVRGKMRASQVPQTVATQTPQVA